MRLLILILLLPFITQGQIVRTHPYYKPFAASCSYLLDQYSGASAAYSLRKLDCDYAGSAIRVRRSSDNTESDIGFTTAGDLDTATLKTFVGTGGTDDGAIVKWYNQGTGGSSYDATQSTSTAQPLIMDNGVVLRKNGYVAIFSDGSNDQLNITMNITSNLAYFFAVASRETGGISERYLGFATNNTTHDWSNTSSIAAISIATTNLYQYRNNAYGGQKTVSVGTRYIITSYINGTEMGMAYNSESTNTATTSATALNSTVGAIFSAPWSSTNAYGKFYSSELIIYLSDQSANKTNIVSNINSSWGVY